MSEILHGITKKPVPPIWDFIKSWLLINESSCGGTFGVPPNHIRLGQHFVSEYFVGTHTELFYAKDVRALELIRQFYRDTQQVSDADGLRG